MISDFKFPSMTLCKLSREFIIYPLLQVRKSLVFLKVELVTKKTDRKQVIYDTVNTSNGQI